MSGITFDDAMSLEDSQEQDLEHKVIWKIPKGDSEALLKWLNKELDYLYEINRPRHATMMEHLLIYKGVQFSPKDQKTLNDFLHTSPVARDRRDERLIVNHLMDLTETILSRATRNPAKPSVLPANSEEIHDRNAAKAVLDILNYVAYINDLDSKRIKYKRQSLLTGEGYMAVLWNPELGDIHPAWAEAKENGFLDENGEQLRDASGKKIDEKNPLRTGEVEFSVVDPWRILLQSKDCYDKVDYAFKIDIVDVDELKHEFPHMKHKIKAEGDQRVFDTRSMSFRKLRNETLKFTFWHKDTKFLRGGYEIEFVKGGILSKREFPYEHNDLPFVRLTDIDLEGELHAESFFEQTKNLQWRHNQLTSDVVKNQRLCAKPKWIVPKGRVKLEQLGNDITIVQFSGQIPPRLEVPNPTPSEIFLFRKDLKEDLEQISTVTGTARRSPPPGMTASVSLRFMSELEAERVSVSVSKDQEAMKNIYKQAMSVAGTFYDASDGRTMRVLGNDESFHIFDMNISNLNKAYDVVIGNSGSLPELRASREARIFDALDRRPELLSDAQLIDVLDLGSVDKMTTVVTEALRSAEAENEEFYTEDMEVAEPAPYEDHITHWKTHVLKLQSGSLKKHAAPEDVTMHEEHVWGTEFLMFEKAKENAAFEAELAKLKLFPIYYRDGQGFSPSSKEQQQAVVQGQANRGDEITDRIGADVEDVDFSDIPTKIQDRKRSK